MDQVLVAPSNGNTTTTAMDPTALSAWMSMAIGFLGLLAAAITQAILAACPCAGAHTPPTPWGRCLCLGALERVYLCVLGFCTVNFWRGVWLLCDVYVLPEHPLESSLVTHLAGTIVLLLSGHVVSVVAPPFVVVTDGQSEPCAAEATALERMIASSSSMSGDECGVNASSNAYTVIKPISSCWCECCHRTGAPTETAVDTSVKANAQSRVEDNNGKFEENM